MQVNITDAAFTAEIDRLARQGIKADRRNLIEDIGAQFANHREWVREYVVNAYDAGATWCRIAGRESEEELTIVVDDNGHGMDEHGLRDFMTLFRSVKKGDVSLTVGRFGIGKASIIAIPDLTRFALQTSTGNESWRMQTTSLLDEGPVRLEQFEPVAPRGTSFSISFKKCNSLVEEMKELDAVLSKYLRFLPISITILRSAIDKTGKPCMRLQGLQIPDREERFERRFSFQREGLNFVAWLGIGAAVHEVYQNRVLITDSYDLLNHGSVPGNPHLNIPHLQIRLDSPDFQLPFGRHRLRNEEVLGPVAKHLRERIVPNYYSELCMYWNSDGLDTIAVKPEEMEDFTCGLIGYDTSSHQPWTGIEVFRSEAGNDFSLVSLRQEVHKTGILYLAGNEDTGADYSVFNGPVLSRHQPHGGLPILEKMFANELVDLDCRDLTMEIPNLSSAGLPEQVRRFQSYIGFHPWAELDQLSEHKKERTRPESPPSVPGGLDSEAMARFLESVGKEAKEAKAEVEALAWRLSFLVCRDGRTPSTAHRFLFIKNTVVLNLYHPDVQALLKLSERLPDLAGHWSLAMCLSEGNKILPYLTPESREELIRLDAIARCRAEGRPIEAAEVRKNNEAKRLLRSFVDGMFGEKNHERQQ